MERDHGELRSALSILQRSPLRSPARLAVMLLLAARGPLEFSDIQRALGLTPGNLWSHLEKLKEKGLVKISYKPSLGRGPRMTIEATSRGLEELIKYINALKTLEATARKAEGDLAERL